MNRHSLSDNCGMLFVFPEARAHCMWMQNTLIPLSAAFIDEQGIIVNIADMQPNTRRLSLRGGIGSLCIGDAIRLVSGKRDSAGHSYYRPG